MTTLEAQVDGTPPMANWNANVRCARPTSRVVATHARCLRAHSLGLFRSKSNRHVNSVICESRPTTDRAGILASSSYQRKRMTSALLCDHVRGEQERRRRSRSPRARLSATRRCRPFSATPPLTLSDGVGRVGVEWVPTANWAAMSGGAGGAYPLPGGGVRGCEGAFD